MSDTKNQYLEADPYAVAVSDMNERQSSPVTSSIQESIEQQGVIQPPLVRERDGVDSAEVPYEAVVGQRRVLGAQAASGVDTIPVVVVGWDDAEALEASITENIDAFRELVDPQDRAQSVFRLMEMRGYNQRQVGERLGVKARTINQWLEYTRDEWAGTEVHFETDDTETEQSSPRTSYLDSGKDRTHSVQKVREATGGGEDGVGMLRKASEEGLSGGEVHEATRRVRAGASVESAVHSVAAEKGTGTEKHRVQINTTFSGDEAEALTTAAKQRGATENQVARQEIVRYLESEGFL